MRLLIPPAIALLAGCSSGDPSIVLIFPNEAARAATEFITVEVRSVAAIGAELDCGSFRGTAREGKTPPGSGAKTGFDYPLAPGSEIDKLPAGRQVIYVLGFMSRADDAPPILEGCTDAFNSEGDEGERIDVPVRLELVIPESARLVKIAGDRTVGREADRKDIELIVRVDANAPIGGLEYHLPGVAIRFTSGDQSFALAGADPGAIEAISDEEGLARATVTLPAEPELGEVLVTAEELDGEAPNDEARWKQTFRLAVVARAELSRRATIDGRGVPIALALGNLIAGSAVELAILSCDGGAAGCTPGAGARAPLGATSLAVIEDPAGMLRTARVIPPPNGLGVLPAGLVIADLLPAPENELAILESRRADCQSRVCRDAACACFGSAIGAPCPCEGSQVIVMRANGGGDIVFDRRETLTASNAVGIAAIRFAGDNRDGLAIVAEGRTPSGRRCSRIDPCADVSSPSCTMSPELCGCPRGEVCGCVNQGGGEVCSCRGDDQLIDLLQARGDGLINSDGCQILRAECIETGGGCCADPFRGNACGRLDSCGCAIPERIFIGAARATTIPRGIVTGALRGASWDAVVPTETGLGLVGARPANRSFEFLDQPITNARVDLAAIAELDSESDAAPDVVFAAHGACNEGFSFDRSCPIFRPLEGARGCLGSFYTAGQASIFAVQPPERGGCRRHQLSFDPAGVCVGKFNGDEAVDVAVASPQIKYVAIFSGDGFGGFLDPPDEIPLPETAGGGGPLACGDMNGDGADELAVADQMTGDVYILY